MDMTHSLTISRTCSSSSSWTTTKKEASLLSRSKSRSSRSLPRIGKYYYRTLVIIMMSLAFIGISSAKSSVARRTFCFTCLTTTTRRRGTAAAAAASRHCFHSKDKRRSLASSSSHPKTALTSRPPKQPYDSEEGDEFLEEQNRRAGSSRGTFFSSIEEVATTNPNGRRRDRLPPPMLDSFLLEEEEGGFGVGYGTDYAPLDEDTTSLDRAIWEEEQRSATNDIPTTIRDNGPTIRANIPATTRDTPTISDNNPSYRDKIPTIGDLEVQLEQLVRDIYAENDGVEFNINSSVQVSEVIFGPEGGSTEKSVLEAKAASGHKMSDLILKYRSLQQRIRRLARKEKNIARGVQVTNAAAVIRPALSPASSPRVVHSADPLMLVDASSYIYRAYYSMPPIHRTDGMPVGALMGFCNMLNKLTLDQLAKGETPRLVLVFDAKGKTFRHDLYEPYKQNRPNAPMDLIPQFQLVRDAAHAYGMHAIEADSYEADDIIATLTAMALSEGIDVNIFSGDKDLMQLVTEKDVVPSVQIIDPASMSRVTFDQVLEKWNVAPSQLGDVLALAGDTADNVPGVPGIGPKIAAQLVQEFGNLTNILDNTSSIRQKARRQKLEEYRDQALLSRTLVELVPNVPLEMMTMNGERIHFNSIGELRVEPLDADRVLSFFDAMGFRETKRRFLSALKRDPRRRRPPSPPLKRLPAQPKTTIPQPDDFSDVPF